MARRKKGRKGRRKGRRSRKGSRVSSRSPGAAVEAGALLTAANFAMKNPLGGSGLVPYVVANKKLPTWNDTVAVSKANATTLQTYTPFVAGVLIHWGKNKPVIGIVGRPLNKMSKKYLHRPL